MNLHLHAGSKCMVRINIDTDTDTVLCVYNTPVKPRRYHCAYGIGHSSCSLIVSSFRPGVVDGSGCVFHSDVSRQQP